MPSPCFVKHDQLRNVLQWTHRSTLQPRQWTAVNGHSSLLRTEPPISLGCEAVDTMMWGCWHHDVGLLTPWCEAVGTMPDRDERNPCPWQESKLRRSVKADSKTACRAHAVPLPCRAAKGLECVFSIWFTQCGRVWFTLVMPRPCYALTMPFFLRLQHSTAVSRRPCCAVALRRTAWSEHSMGAAWQVWIRHGRTV